MLIAVLVTAAGGSAVQAADDPSYDWDDGTVQGWSVDWDGADPVSSSVVAHSGDRSLALSVQRDQYPGFRSPSRSLGLGAGSVLTLHVYAPRGARALQVRPYVTDKSYAEHFGAKSRLEPGEWTTVTCTVPSVSGVHHLGVGGRQSVVARTGVSRRRELDPAD